VVDKKEIAPAAAYAACTAHIWYFKVEKQNGW
jgi:hypothetical protein